MKRNSILENIIHLFYSTILANVLNASTLILLANHFNSASYGIFSVALAISMMMHFFTDLGVSNTFLREGSKKESISSKLASYVKVRILCLLAAFLIFGILVQVLYQDQHVIFMMYSLMVPLVIGLTLQTIAITYFQLMEAMQFIAKIKIVSAMLLVASVIICMTFDINIYLSAFLYGLSYLCGGIYSMYQVRRKTAILLGSPFQKELLNKLGPFFMSGLFIMLTPQLGPLVLEKTLPFALVGLFAVAYRIPSALYQIPGVIAGAFYPLLFKHYSKGEVEQHTNLHLLQLKIMSFFGICITIALFYLAPYLIELLFRDAWENAVEPLKILSFIIVLQGFNIAIADSLTTRGMQSRRMNVQLLTIGVGVFSLYYLSLHYGVMGAAFAIVIMEMTAFAGYILASPVRRRALVQVIIPYGSYYAAGFLFIHYFLHLYPLAAMLVTIFFITALIVLLDRDTKEDITEWIQKKAKKKRVKT